MIGTVALYTMSGHPWPGGERLQFEAAEICAFGRLAAYNDFVTRYLARLADGRVVFVKMVDQSAAEQKWIAGIRRAINREDRARRIAGGIGFARLTRDNTFVITWKDVMTK